MLVSCPMRDGFKAFFTKRKKGPNLQNRQIGIVTEHA